MPDTPVLQNPPQPRRRFFFAASVTRTLFEMAGASVIVWSLLYVFFPFSQQNRDLSIVSLIGPTAMLYYVLRLRLLPTPWNRRHALDVLLAFAIGLLLGIMGAIYAFYTFHRLNTEARPLASSLATYSTASPLIVSAAIGTLSTMANWAVYIVGRFGVRLLRFWNRLRRRHLLWALTNSHVLLVASVAGFFILALDSIAVSMYASSNAYNLIVLIPLTAILLVPSFIAMLCIVPPFALVSYFVIRRATDRLRNLMFATSALRSGNYAVRVRVEGEDEVAQLQHDFNAMATNLERTMRDLQQERDHVSRLLQERRELIANVSHELRTPVATMRGYMETALMHWDEMSLPRLQHDMRVMEEETIQLQARVEDLFMLARAEVGMLKLQPIPTDAADLVRHMVDARAALAWRSSRIEVIADIAPDLPLVMSDPHRLSQALQNLLHNGLRHTSPGGIVAVVVTARDHEVVFQVKDTGEGIAPQDLPHIWERFYQT
ncbi:MAG: HAMP domain-containing protein, partial [Ktedonobacteraceae bacterium]|nr:HAMP domain-containing protein [Ktedonobacteraceae bacterium]